MVCFAIITPFKSKQYHTDIFSIAQNVGIVNALPTKLRQCFFYGSFKGEPADHFVDIFLSDETAVNDVLLPVNLIFRDTLREVLVLLVQLKHLSGLLSFYGRCCCLFQLSPFRLRLSISTRIGFLLQGVTPAQLYYSAHRRGLSIGIASKVFVSDLCAPDSLRRHCYNRFVVGYIFNPSKDLSSQRRKSVRAFLPRQHHRQSCYPTQVHHQHRT